MTNYHDFLRTRLANGGFTMEDALASFLPLARQALAAHRAESVAPLEGLQDLRVEDARIWFEEAKLRPPSLQNAKVRALDKPAAQAVEVVGEFRLTADVDGGEDNIVNLLIGKAGAEVVRPVYLPGHVTWEQTLGHHDPLTDIFSLGMILSGLICNLDLSDPDDLTAFVRHRDNLFEVNPKLHPVVAKAATAMTQLSRRRRPQDLAALVHTLENYRDQDVNFEIDLARGHDWQKADRLGKRELILAKLQQRLFELTRRNRLLHFRQTMHSVNLTLASVPLCFDYANIRPEQILTASADFQKTLAAGKALSLNRYLRFEEALYLPSLLDEIRNAARRDTNEFGLAQLRLVLCFFRWSNLKEKPETRFDSPLVLLPVQLTKGKGVRDVYTLEPHGTEAEINPVLRHYLKQLYAVDLPEKINLATTPLEALHALLVAKVQSSEPGVTIALIDRPRIQLIKARAQRRLEQYQRRVRISGRGVRTFADTDYSYDRDNYHPLGLRLFQTRIRSPQTRLHAIIQEAPRPRQFMAAPDPPALDEKEQQLYALATEETNPFRWEFDLCNVTLGNFRYQKMSLVRDYADLIGSGAVHPAFDKIFSLDPRPAAADSPPPLPLDENNAIMPWDPTQASAIALARTGADFIIQGPPGTGKSQTITNLIADYVTRGKRVLFVCEKRAAIDVVYHRLHQAGLRALCCLIHDSQADKKEFIQDLKATYEGFLEEQGKKQTVAQDQRRQLLEGLKRDLQPLQSFHESMRSSPAQATTSLHGLLQRALELRDRFPGITAPKPIPVPPYRQWEEHRERVNHLATLASEIRSDGSLAAHPLRNLNCVLAREQGPRERIADYLARIGKLLDDVEQMLQGTVVSPATKDTLEASQRLASFAAAVQFLAAKNRLALLLKDSSPTQQFTKTQRAYQTRSKDLGDARSATKAWRQKPTPEETKIAREQARALERSTWRIFKPAWWRLRGFLNRAYDFSAHAVKPTWGQILDALSKEQDIEAGIAKIENQARETFGFEGALPAFMEQITAAKDFLANQTANIQALHRRLANDARGGDILLQLARLAQILPALTKELAGLLNSPRFERWHEIRAEIAGIDKALDDLDDFLPCLAELAALPNELAEACRCWPGTVPSLETVVAQRCLEDIFKADKTLARFDEPAWARQAGRLEKACDRLQEVNGAVTLERVRTRFLDNVRLSNSPVGQLEGNQKELKAVYNRGRRELEHEFGKTMRYKSIRDLVANESGLVLQDLKPIWLMSPLSVADTLPMDADHFDVAIFDEASQVTLEMAVPVLFRTKQIIVVGDQMQLPPTNFFAAKQVDGDEDSLQVEGADGVTLAYDLDSNSFLNHAERNLPSTMLCWHYRSRSESLISFSNAAFYQGRLLSVPEVALPARDRQEILVKIADNATGRVAQLTDRPVSFHFLEDGVYEQRRNTAEADYIASLVQGLLSDGPGHSIGIVAFSEAQQDEIQNALNRLARKDADFRDRLEAESEREEDGQFIGLLVKNLENIQGDERDVVILSVCYGHNAAGKMLMNFGPINQSGGERRLNVAFSRAKRHMAVVSSIRQQDITNDYNEGARCLKNYLRYAQAVSAGDLAAARRVLWETNYREAPRENAADADITVAELTNALRERGYLVDCAVGQSEFRCDLAVRREKDPSYRLGILVDTKRHYEQDDIIARDVLRPRLLRTFGWQVAHVLTKDWYDNREGVLEALVKLVERKSSGPKTT